MKRAALALLLAMLLAVDVQPEGDASFVWSPPGAWAPAVVTYTVINEAADYLYVTATTGADLVYVWPPVFWVSPCGHTVVVVSPNVSVDAAGCFQDYVTLSAESRLAGDVNGDGAVDVEDLLSLVEAFGLPDPRCDFNGDGIVDAVDLLIFVENFGR